MEVGPVVVDAVLGPEAAQQGERFVEDRGSGLAGDAERLMFGRDRVAEPEGGQRPAAGEPVEAGPRLGEQHRVAAGEDLDAGAELEPLGASRRERQPDDRVGRVAGDPLREPQRIEPVALEGVDELTEPVLVDEALDPEAVADPDLHVRNAS